MSAVRKILERACQITSETIRASASTTRQASPIARTTVLGRRINVILIRCVASRYTSEGSVDIIEVVCGEGTRRYAFVEGGFVLRACRGAGEAGC